MKKTAHSFLALTCLSSASFAGRLEAEGYRLQEAKQTSSSATSTSNFNSHIQDVSMVTASDYCIFLNAVAASDPHHLYDEAMASDSDCHS